MNCIIPDEIYLGSVFDIITKNLHKNKIKRIINCCFEDPVIDLKDYEYHKIEIYDSENQEIISTINKVCKILKNKKTTFINCRAGISRSATIVIGVLIKNYGLSFNESFRFVSNKRTCIYPNMGFMLQLKKFEKECKNEREKRKKNIKKIEKSMNNLLKMF